MTADQPKISRTNSSNVTTDNSGTSNNTNTITTNTNRGPSPDRLKKMKLSWPGRREFLKAQAQIAGILLIAAFGNKWKPSYNRNDNHDMFTFWLMNGLILAVGIFTLKHDANGSARGVQLLSRPQTEEWKGWMQWVFIMYHYYRAYNVYNVIRVFVSAYVWMTGFGNFLYFEKAQDFSIDRAVSMWLRINYFPLLLSFGLSVSLENYYVVPLHTAAFFVTMATCYVANILKNRGWDNYWHRNGAAIGLCFVVHILFYETPLVESLRVFSDEYYFRFQADKYTAIVGILSGYVWAKFKAYMQWAYAGEQPQVAAMWAQRIGGASLIYIWWALFGHINDKYAYNPIHPYCFWLPVAGWLMLRNSSKYLCELHSEALEFFGKITLETYVLQFHVFMNHNVKEIPVILPGSGKGGIWIMKFLNMALCGVCFVAMAYYARKITITTQTTVHELMTEIKKGGSGQSQEDDHRENNEEMEKFVPSGKISGSESISEGMTNDKV